MATASKPIPEKGVGIWRATKRQLATSGKISSLDPSLGFSLNDSSIFRDKTTMLTFYVLFYLSCTHWQQN